ncbi:F-box protein FBW2 [Capsicum chinense]|nr:F-box protein FBW2 [Capsicum chinense]
MGKKVKGIYCWQEIDIEEWSKNCYPENLDRMLRLLIPRSCDFLCKLCVSGLSNKLSFEFIVNNAKSLQTLWLPQSELSDSVVEQVAGTFSNITFLDISYCIKIGARALEAIGKHCKCLTGSSGYIPWDFVAGNIDDDFDDDEMSDGYWEDEERLEDMEIWFYDDLNAVDAGYDWPKSP